MIQPQCHDVPPSQRLSFVSSAIRYNYERFGNSKIENVYITQAVPAAQMAAREVSRLYAPRDTRRMAMAFAQFSLGMMLYTLDKVCHDNDAVRLRLAIHHPTSAVGPPRDTMKMLLWQCMDSLTRLDSYQYHQTKETSLPSEDFSRATTGLIQEDDEASPQNRVSIYFNYCSKLLSLYELNYETQLLDQVVTQIDRGLILANPGGEEWAHLKALHGRVFLSQYRRGSHEGSILEKGIACCNGVLKSAQPLAEVRSLAGDLLSGLIRHRHDLLQVTEDIICAVVDATRAVHALPHDSSRVPYLNNLAIMLLRKFDRLNDVDDLNHAISRIKEAIVLAPRGSHLRVDVLITLGGSITRRLLVKNDMADLDEAVKILKEVVELASKSHAKLYVFMNSMLNMYESLVKSDESNSHSTFTSRALDVCQSIIWEMQPITCAYAEQLQNMGGTLMLFRGLDAHAGKYTITDDAIKVFGKASFYRIGSLSACISATISAAKARLFPKQEERHIAAADRFLRHGISLLRHVSPRMLQQHEQAHILRQFSGLTTMTAAVVLEAQTMTLASVRDRSGVEDALCLLEDGRGIILGWLFEMRADVSELQKKCPELAAKFLKIRDMLDEPISSKEMGIYKPPDVSPPPQSLSVTSRSQLARDLDKTVMQIRSQPGFSSFLQSPDVAEMRRAVAPVGASGTHGMAVVVNVSHIRCDAFIVSADHPVHQIALPDLNYDAIRCWTKVVRNAMRASDAQFYALLAGLWKAVVLPILVAIRELDIERFERYQNADNGDIDQPRIWWVPTGLLNALPIHAAGPYSHTGELSNMNLATHRYWTRTISAYSPSIKALLFTRSNVARECAENKDSKSAMLHRAPSLLASMSETPGQQSLTFVAPEVEGVRSCLARTKGPPPTILHKPDKATVLEGLRAGAPILHFAGHGYSDTGDPLKSALLMNDWQTDKLTVGDLQALRLHEQYMPFLAYLSACSTGANHAADLVDEGLHLMSACQLAGFRNVVGSLWPVDDRCCQTVAQSVYTAVAEASNTGADLDTAVAIGLLAGVSSIRDGEGIDRGDRYAYKPGDGKPKRVRPHPRCGQDISGLVPELKQAQYRWIEIQDHIAKNPTSLCDKILESFVGHSPTDVQGSGDFASKLD